MTISYKYANRISEFPRYERDGKIWIDDNYLVHLMDELFLLENLKKVFHFYDEKEDIQYWTFLDGSSLTIANGWQHHGKPATYQARA